MDHVLDLALRHVLGLGVGKGLLDGSRDGLDLGVNFSGGGTVVREGEDQGGGTEVLDNGCISFHTESFLNILKKLNYSLL